MRLALGWRPWGSRFPGARSGPWVLWGAAFPWGAHLDKVPALVQAALDFVTVEELGQPTLGVVHQAAGVREERGGPQGAQVQEALLGVAGELGREERAGGGDSGLQGSPATAAVLAATAPGHRGALLRGPPGSLSLGAASPGPGGFLSKHVLRQCFNMREQE